MSRNVEKHAGRLNRLWLQRLDEENAEKNPIRPGLGSLHTAEQVKKWMPSIKKDIDFYLKQSQVGCYPEGKISEFSEKIESLTKEYKAYLRKYRTLGGDRDSTPWSDQPYLRKHKFTEDAASECDKELPKKSPKVSGNQDKSEKNAFIPISLPIMDNDDCSEDIYTYSIVNIAKPVEIDIEENNQPLQFNWNKYKALEYHNEGDDNKCISSENQNDHESNSCLCVTNDSSGYLKYSEKCPNTCTDCSGVCLKNVCNCPVGNQFQVIDDDVRRKRWNDNLSNNKIPSKSDDSLQLQVNSGQTSAGRSSILNSVNLQHTEIFSENNSASKNVGNMLNLPYSDSSSEDDT
ncbi:uncharacterized protein LOC132749945 [Ruditapes philippinarum]|uniref:uncharacterized protein LOC132749945 n=1 Tax=Ruditapes philippinarum TaxID=129788 RepID=UPI00295AFA1A|nr:uncharacterized protein LOC132749945 [Ruditapes philippinarum]